MYVPILQLGNNSLTIINVNGYPSVSKKKSQGYKYKAFKLKNIIP